jgi:hypothetical protein
MRRPRVQFTLASMMIAMAVLGPLVWGLTYRSRPISESEAIRLAEEFVIRNGYTDLPADPDRRKLTPEPVVLSSNIEEELEYRHDTLERKAHAAFGHPGGWVIYFHYKHKQSEWSRGVIMDSKGHHMHVAHQDMW